jgi:hypothetical protein
MTSPWTDDLMPPGGRPHAPGTPWSGAAARSGGGPSAAITALIVVVAIAVLVIPVASLLRGGESFWPEEWDARVAPIAQRDEQLRGLEFEHPVVVRFLGDTAFNKASGTDGESVGAFERAEIARQSATFRALGFIDGDVDLFDATKQTGEAGVLAFYDFNKKEIVVRGTDLDISHRATLAHELVHVLQDQHFDIREIERRSSADDVRTGASSGAMLALIEGDANRVEAAYVKGLSAAQQSQHDREQEALGSEFGEATTGVPPFVRLLFSAPYEFGPPTIRMLIADGGNGAVNAALTGPTPTSADFVQAGLIEPPPPNLPAPPVDDGEDVAGPPESFGAFELYIMLATRDDPVTALTASDTILGGRAQGVRQAGRYCYRATVATRSGAAATFVVDAVRRWAQSASGASVTRDGTSVTFTACDPGPRAVGATKEKLEAAEVLLGARSEIAASAAEGGAPSATARCVARLFAVSPGAIDILKRAGTGSLPAADLQQLRTRVQQQTLTCKDNPKTGLL